MDTDILIYKVACLNEETFDFGDTGTAKVTNLEKAKEHLEELVEDVRKKTRTSDVLLTLSDDVNFRYSVDPTYKGNRKDKEEPELRKQLKDFVRSRWECVQKPELEGDDVMGIMATHFPDKFIICSIDKDLLQIPGTHYNWNRNEFTKVSALEGTLFFYKQILTGDTADGYKGCPGIGPKKADKLLNTVVESEPKCLGTALWGAIVDAYSNKGLTEEDALVQARLARILRANNWDFKLNRLILWTP